MATSRPRTPRRDRKSTRLNSSHVEISYAVFCLKKNIYMRLIESWDRVSSDMIIDEYVGVNMGFQILVLIIDIFFFNDTATPEIYPLSLHDALPICDRDLDGGAGVRRHRRPVQQTAPAGCGRRDRKSTRLNSSHVEISYAVFCL